MAVYNDDEALAIIGDGKVAQTLFKYLSSQGMTIDCLVTRHNDRIAPLTTSLGVRVTDTPTGISDTVRTILLCVPDGEIAHAAASILQTELQVDGLLIAHTSGFRTSDELRLLAERGAVTGSLHPIQSFHSANMDPEVLHNIGCGIEGSDAFTARATALANAISWQPLVVRKDQKPLYHAACVFAGNFLVALAADATDLMNQATGGQADSSHILPMMNAVLERLGTTAPKDALTGPAARGDADTAGIHKAALEEVQGDYGMLYAAWTSRILALTNADTETYNRVLNALRPPEKD